MRWIQSNRPHLPDDIIALDGKTLRRSFDTASIKHPLHLVSAWSHKLGLVLAQRAVDVKSNEITAIPEVLKTLNIKGCIVTIDAMGCQKDIAAQIIEQQGDYILSVKGNHKVLQQDLDEFVAWAKETHFKDIAHSYFEWTEKDHGRIETRRVWSIEHLDWLKSKKDWKGLRSIAWVESERTIEGKTTLET